MRVVINQSNYIPWKGYFDLMHDADLFIFLDDVQYTHNDWRNRNRIKTPQGVRWLTIPVGRRSGQLLNEVLLPAGDWPATHWESLRHAYSKRPHFSFCAALLQDSYRRAPGQTISAFNQFLIERIARDLLRIKTPVIDSSTLPTPGRKQERVLGLLKAVGAKTYITGPAARDYIDPAGFEAAGIEIAWKEYGPYPEYPQGTLPFEHAVSIVDLLFNTGPAAADHIWGCRRRPDASA